MDVASVAPSVSPSITGQQVREAYQRTDQNDQVAKERSAQTEKVEKEAAAKATQAAGEQAKAPVEAPKPVVNTSGQTIGSRINITA